MAKYRIAWLPGDGIGVDVLEATRLVLDRLQLEAEFLPGDIGWEFWRREGESLPQRTMELLKSVDAALFGAITSKPAKAAAAEVTYSGQQDECVLEAQSLGQSKKCRAEVDAKWGRDGGTDGH